MRAALATLALAAGCNSILGNGDFSGPGGDDGGDACSGIGCMVVDCAAQGKLPTSVSGVVYAPNGTLALSNALVYVPSAPLDPLVDGPGNPGCASGAPVATTYSEATGAFRLDNVPVVPDLPLVIQLGKWRRQITVPAVNECADVRLPPESTRLPRDLTEGNVPRIAMTTGAPEAIECLIRDLGVSDSEVSSGAGTGRIHLYAGPGGTSQIQGGMPLQLADQLFGQLSRYDQVVLGCDADQMPKPLAAAQLLRAYVDAGGWLWLTHFQAAWLAPPAFPPLAQFMPSGSGPAQYAAIIDTSFPRGVAFSAWMVAVGASGVPGEFTVTNGRMTCLATDPSVRRWAIMNPSIGNSIQMFSWGTPADGRVVFADFHLNNAPAPNPYPTECLPSPLTPQAKAIAFQLFEQPTCLP